MHNMAYPVSLFDVGRIRFDAPLREYSRWRIGGCADLVVEPETVQQAQTLRRVLYKYNLPHLFIGDGSNLLFDDGGVRGVIVRMGRAFSKFSISGEFIDAEAGVFIPRLIQHAGRNGLVGLEHTIGIPGTLGGLIFMNGGSMQKGIGSAVDSVKAIDHKGDIVEYSHEACKFSYRCSVFQETDHLIIKARLKCAESGDVSTIRTRMLDILRSRRRKFPLKQPNCGSVFLSNPDMYDTIGPPGKVIEECGFKGFRIGDAMIPHIHANFIINMGHAKSSEVLSIIRTVRETIYRKTGYQLTCEARYVATDCRVLPAHDALNIDSCLFVK